MKKIIGILGLIMALTGCKKDAEQPSLDFNFSVDVSQENFSDKGVNESVNLFFDISADYDYEKVPLKYKIETTNANEISDGSKKILVGDSYTLTEPKLSLHYTGKEKGEHRMKVVFFNQKGKEISKELVLNYKEYGYKLEVLNGNTNPHQGENVDFDLKITPENTSTKDFYLIFKSYDAQDPNLEKTLVALNGEKIVFDKEYKIENLSDIKLRINSFNVGQKQLKYVIKNNTFEREETIVQNIQNNSIEIKSLTFSKLFTDNINETLSIKGFVKKTPTLNKKIWYKTWISDGTRNLDGIENTQNKYQEFTLSDNEEFSINVNTSKTGVYVYKVQFKDEFENESPVTDFTITVKDKTFSIDQTNGNFSNIFQGQTASILFNIQEPTGVDETYKIQFLEFDNNDIYLEKSTILFNGTKVSLKTEIDISKLSNNTIEVSSFHYGNKKLIYKVWNSVGKEIIQETNIEFKQASISGNVEVVGTKIAGENFTLKSNINTLTRQGKIQYKTWAEKKKITLVRVGGIFGSYENKVEYISTNEIPNTGTNWENFTLDNNNQFLLNLLTENTGTYKYYIQFKDEFGNESNIQNIEFSIAPPIIIENLNLNLHERNRNSFTGSIDAFVRWSLNIKVRNINDQAVLTKADVYLPSKEASFFVDYKGKSYSLNIRTGGNTHDDFTLEDRREIERAKMADSDVYLYTIWNISGVSPTEEETIKLLLKEKFKNEYKPRVTIWNSKGHNISVEVPFSNLNFL